MFKMVMMGTFAAVYFAAYKKLTPFATSKAPNSPVVAKAVLLIVLWLVIGGAFGLLYGLLD